MEKKVALMLVDVQAAMYSYEDMTLYNGEQVLNNIHSLLQRARTAEISVIFIQHTESGDSEYAKGKDTWQIHPKVTPLKEENVVEKRTWDAFYGTTLQEVLESLDIGKLIIAGMQTEFCLDTTCRRAFSMGYECILAEDAHSTFDGPVLKAVDIINHHNSIIGGRFAQLKKTEDIIF